jgi:hypothetical protein
MEVMNESAHFADLSSSSSCDDSQSSDEQTVNGDMGPEDSGDDSTVQHHLPPNVAPGSDEFGSDSDDLVLDPSMLDSASLRRLGKQKKVC